MPTLMSEGTPSNTSQTHATSAQEANGKQEAPGVTPLAKKGHVMQQSLPGDWIGVCTETKMQIRSKQKKEASHIIKMC